MASKPFMTASKSLNLRPSKPFMTASKSLNLRPSMGLYRESQRPWSIPPPPIPLMTSNRSSEQLPPDMGLYKEIQIFEDRLRHHGSGRTVKRKITDEPLLPRKIQIFEDRLRHHESQRPWCIPPHPLMTPNRSNDWLPPSRSGRPWTIPPHPLMTPNRSNDWLPPYMALCAKGA